MLYAWLELRCFSCVFWKSWLPRSLESISHIQSVRFATKVVWPLNTISWAFPVGQFVDSWFYFYMNKRGCLMVTLLYMQLLDFQFHLWRLVGEGCCPVMNTISAHFLSSSDQAHDMNIVNWNITQCLLCNIGVCGWFSLLFFSYVSSNVFSNMTLYFSVVVMSCLPTPCSPVRSSRNSHYELESLNLLFQDRFPKVYRNVFISSCNSYLPLG